MCVIDCDDAFLSRLVEKICSRCGSVRGSVCAEEASVEEGSQGREAGALERRCCRCCSKSIEAPIFARRSIICSRRDCGQKQILAAVGTLGTRCVSRPLAFIAQRGRDNRENRVRYVIPWLCLLGLRAMLIHTVQCMLRIPHCTARVPQCTALAAPSLTFPFPLHKSFFFRFPFLFWGRTPFATTRSYWLCVWLRG